MLQQNSTDTDFTDDPFYLEDQAGPLRGISSLRKALSLQERLEKAIAA